MRVIIGDKHGDCLQLISDPPIGDTGHVDNYVNKKTGKADPRVIFDCGRYLHVDTIRKFQGVIYDAETGELADI